MNVKTGNKFIEGFDGDLHFKAKDPSLAAEIKDFMRAKTDLEEIMNDPFLGTARSEAAVAIAEYDQKTKDHQKGTFIKDALAGVPVRKTKKDISEIRFEIGKSDISDLSAEWVKGWHKKMQMQGGLTPAGEERKKFISESLKQNSWNTQVEMDVTETVAAKEPAMTLPVVEQSPKGKIRYMHYVSLSAAAVIGALLMIRTLIPVDPGNLYNTFYDPYPVKSAIERGGSNEEEIYTSAIFSYKSGDYTNAVSLFSDAAAKNPSSRNLFHLGITCLETGNFDEAIRNLTSVVNGSDGFTKEAQWFLGLAYLRKGKTDEARNCFEYLSASSAYYKDRSDKILRRLK
jgi:TolA-binding protein